MSDVKTEKMELEFRSADDLFQNYPISIIRQVVDKSKYAISREVHSQSNDRLEETGDETTRWSKIHRPASFRQYDGRNAQYVLHSEGGRLDGDECMFVFSVSYGIDHRECFQRRSEGRDDSE